MSEKIIEHLKASGEIVGVEDMSAYLRQQGVIVEEHVGRIRSFRSINTDFFGVNLKDKSKSVTSFFNSHVKMGKMKFIPDKYEKSMQNIESSLRILKRRLAIGYDAKYMTMESYDEFNQVLEKKRAEYFDVRDEIVANWDDIVTKFKAELRSTLLSLDSVNKEVLFREITQAIPSKEVYAASFYMNATVKAFPVPSNMDMFDEDMQKQLREGIEQETLVTLKQVVGSAMNEAVEVIGKLLTTFRDVRVIPPRTIGAVKSAAKRIGSQNVLHHPKVNEVKELLEAIPQASPDYGEMASQAEMLAYLIYGYSEELEIDGLLNLYNFPISSADLKDNYEMLKL